MYYITHCIHTDIIVSPSRWRCYCIFQHNNFICVLKTEHVRKSIKLTCGMEEDANDPGLQVPLTISQRTVESLVVLLLVRVALYSGIFQVVENSMPKACFITPCKWCWLVLNAPSDKKNRKKKSKIKSNIAEMYKYRTSGG